MIGIIGIDSFVHKLGWSLLSLTLEKIYMHYIVDWGSTIQFVFDYFSRVSFVFFLISLLNFSTAYYEINWTYISHSIRLCNSELWAYASAMTSDNVT